MPHRSILGMNGTSRVVMLATAVTNTTRGLPHLPYLPPPSHVAYPERLLQANFRSSALPSHDLSKVIEAMRGAGVVYHLHISKVGGTTLRGEGARLIRRKDCKVNLRGSNVDAYLRDHRFLVPNSKPACQYISVESCTYTALRKLPSAHTFIVTMVRNPIEHWMSEVRHNRWVASKCLDGITLKCNKTAAKRAVEVLSSPTTFLTLGNVDFISYDTRNVQTRWLGPSVSGAVEHISRNNTLVLIHEFFDVSMCLMAYVSGNWDAVKTKCTCSNGGPHVVGELNKVAQKKDGGSGSYSPTFGRDHGVMATLTGWLMADFRVYGEALRIFQEDVREAERRVGQRFFCYNSSIENHALSMAEREYMNRDRRFDRP